MRVVSSACMALLFSAGTLFAQQLPSPSDTAQNPVEPKAPHQPMMRENACRFGSRVW
ncbi:MAG: hypothetical protein WA374_12110 [Acidobacteriaceae bacterium]